MRQDLFFGETKIAPFGPSTVAAHMRLCCVVKLMNHAPLVEWHVPSIWNNWHFVLVPSKRSPQVTCQGLNPLSAITPLTILVERLHRCDPIFCTLGHNVSNPRHVFFRSSPVPLRRRRDEGAPLHAAGTFEQPVPPPKTPCIIPHVQFTVNLHVPGAFALELLRKRRYGTIDALDKLELLFVPQFDNRLVGVIREPDEIAGDAHGACLAFLLRQGEKAFVPEHKCGWE